MSEKIQLCAGGTKVQTKIAGTTLGYQAKLCTVACPSNCSACPSTYALTLSGLTGACAVYNGTFTLSHDGFCGWYGPGYPFTPHSISCNPSDKHWYYYNSTLAISVDLGTGSCPPTGTFSAPLPSGCTGSLTVTLA